VYTRSLRALIDELGRLPGIGPKSAQRIAFHLLKVSTDDAYRLTDAIVAVKERTTLCERCFNVAEGELCDICRDPRRDATVLCVVEEPRDIVALEKTHDYRGGYHVLQGAINPIEGVGPEQQLARAEATRVDDHQTAFGSQLQAHADVRGLGLGLTQDRAGHAQMLCQMNVAGQAPHQILAAAAQLLHAPSDERI